MITLTQTADDSHVVEPLGWRVRGVISPVGVARHFQPKSLICCAEGVIAATRGFRPFLLSGLWAGLGASPTIDAETTREVAAQLRDGEITRYDCADISNLHLSARFTYRLRIATSDGRRDDYAIYARSAVNEYRELLNSLFAGRFSEEGVE